MKNCRPLSYKHQVQLRIWACRVLILSLLIFVFVVGQTGGGDSRVTTNDAHAASTLIVFGTLAWAIWRICLLKRLLPWPKLLKEQLLAERDEHRRYLHDKSGGIVWDVLTVGIVFITLVSSLYNMDAFRAARAILLLALAAKGAAYAYYSRR